LVVPYVYVSFNPTTVPSDNHYDDAGAGDGGDDKTEAMSEAPDDRSVYDGNETRTVLGNPKRICKVRRDTGSCACVNDDELDHTRINPRDCDHWLETAKCLRKEFDCYYKHHKDKQGAVCT
jgi:hypothetical protein